MTTYIIPHSFGSKGYQSLRRGLGLKSCQKKRRWSPNDTLINWGVADVNHFPNTGTWVNSPDNVALAVNKFSAFEALHAANVPTPDWTDGIMTAKVWIEQGNIVYGRKLLRGSEGRGIEVYTTEDEVNDCPLYTKYLKHKQEYRIHVVGTEVIDVQQKRKRKDFGREHNKYIRNLDNGYIFARDGVVVDDGTKQVAIDAVAALGLDFGAVDIGYREREHTAYVFEVNTAPGLEGTTLQNYINAFRRYL